MRTVGTCRWAPSASADSSTAWEMFMKITTVDPVCGWYMPSDVKPSPSPVWPHQPSISPMPTAYWSYSGPSDSGALTSRSLCSPEETRLPLPSAATHPAMSATVEIIAPEAPMAEKLLNIGPTSPSTGWNPCACGRDQSSSDVG